jgi:hypothetical protein
LRDGRAVGESEGAVVGSRAALNDAVLRASCDTTSGGRLPARRGLNTEWKVSGEIVVAVAWLSDTVIASDDDVGAEGVAGTEGSVRIVCWADESTGGWVVCDLRARDSGRGGEEESRVHHFACIQDEVFTRGGLV